ncbi:MAG: hypothetical protein RIG84_16565 [Roseovarius sp.]
MVVDDPPMVARSTPAARAPRLLVHVPATLLERHGQEGFGLYGRVASHMRGQGIEVRFLERPSTTELDGYTKEDFHLVHHGFLRRFNVLNSGVAYVFPYWYLDQRGVLCDSSMANATPDLDSVKHEAAVRFFEGMRERLVLGGVSKYEQPARAQRFGPGHIAVFLQGMGDPVLRNMFMLETEMLDLVLRHRGEREVVVKPHPKWPDTMASDHARRLAEETPGLTITDANVHDMLEGAYCSVSICSGASFEGIFHRTPSILFGRSDFNACAVTVRSAAEAEEALAGIGAREFDFERFAYWFLRRKMFNSRNPNVGERVMQRIARTGFEFLPSKARAQAVPGGDDNGVRVRPLQGEPGDRGDHVRKVDD